MRPPTFSSLLVSAGVAAVFIASGAVATGNPTAASRRTISVTGHGEVTAAPDIAVLTVTVETTAPRAADAVRDNASRSVKVVRALKGLVGDQDTITTTRYSLEPRYEPAKRGGQTPPHIIGYVARNAVEVRSRKIEAVGAFIDAATTAGANRVSGLQFTLSNRNKPLRAALKQAGAEARAQAESVAHALGVTLGSVTSATTSTGPIVQPRYFQGRGMAAAMKARPPTQVEPGTISVSATLQVTYEIQ
ncbi:MAG: SIMPL domain-containing protein [Candidatus Binatia bacterium]